MKGFLMVLGIPLFIGAVLTNWSNINDHLLNIAGSILIILACGTVIMLLEKIFKR